MRNPILIVVSLYLIGGLITRAFLAGMNQWAEDHSKESLTEEMLWVIALSWPLTWSFCLIDRLRGERNE